jgi:uncharacterized protein YxjI
MPLTDKRGFILRLVHGEYVLKINEMGSIISTYRGGKVYDAKGNDMDNGCNFNPTLRPKIRTDVLPIPGVNGRSEVLYNYNGYPLTDTMGVSLIDAFGKPILILGNNRLRDLEGKPAYRMDGTLYSEGAQVALRPDFILFDKEGKPLTSDVGTVLRTRKREPLVKSDGQGDPVSDIYGGDLFDLKGRSIKNNRKANPSHKPSHPRKIIFGGDYQLFNRDDLPLVDPSGAMLYTSSGTPLLRLDKRGTLISDYMGYPVFDENGIPVVKYLGKWVDQKGLPYRLFTKEGDPLTSAEGEELYNIEDKCLIIGDGIGRPMYDWRRILVRDASGLSILDYNFRGGTQVQPASARDRYEEEGGRPLEVFDWRGLPMTDRFGEPLTDSKGSLLLVHAEDSIRDRQGKKVFDKNGLPLGCNKRDKILSLNGKPAKLFNSSGWPVTSYYGTPLRYGNGHLMVVFDKYGRPKSDPNGRPLLDWKKRSRKDKDFNCEEGPPSPEIRLMRSKDKPLRLYDLLGRPRTDLEGRVLVLADGTPLVPVDFEEIGSMGDEIYDEYGLVISKLDTVSRDQNVPFKN